MIFGFNGFAAVAASSEGAGASRRLFDGADTTGEIRFTSVRLQRKQKRCIRGQEFVVRGQDAVPSGPSKTLERAQSGPKRYLSH